MHLTVIPGDKTIYLETPNATYYPTQFPMRRCHIIDNDQEFWNNVDPRIHAIQYHTDGIKEFELKNPSENKPITDVSSLQKYIDRFNLSEQTFQAQVAWDLNNVKDETLEQKITRLGPRP
ncbi:hypothetical protein EBU71_21055 [bacterium]|nr:hypothetical protein [Candidatus Elulimicrobium humile]